MRAHALALDLGVAVLSEYNADGFLGIGIDAYGEDAAGLQPAEAHHPFGFLGRPLDPDVDGAGQPTLGASLYRFDEENGTTVLVCGDPRVTAKLPQVAKGGSIQYGTTAALDVAYAHFDGADGSWVVHVPAGAAKARIEFDGGPSIEVTNTAIELGGPGALPAAVASPAFLAWLGVVGAASGAGAPPGDVAATKVKVL